MELFTDKQIKDMGIDLINNYIKVFNSKNMYEKKKFDNYFIEYQKKIGMKNENYFDDKNANSNVEKSKKYIDTIIDLDLLDRVLEATQRTFEDENIIFIRIFDNIIFSEQQIADAIDYNKLLKAIPTEAKKTIKKSLIQEKNVDKLKQDLVSFEYMSKNNNFRKLLLNHIENATFQFARQYFCFIVINAILSVYGIEEDINIILPHNNKTYNDAKNKIKEVFKYSKRVKNFKTTEFYLKFLKYINLDKVMEEQAFKKEQTEVVHKLYDMITDKNNNTTIHSNKMLEFCEDNLFKQGWWYYGKE